MLHKLENSGLPIYRDDETGKLALEAPLTYKGFAEKTLSQMKGLFADDSGNDPNEKMCIRDRNTSCWQDGNRGL